MKPMLNFVTGLLLITLAVSCNGQSGKENKKENTQAGQTLASVNSKANNAPVHLTKAEFLKLVVDYEKNPDTWKFEGDKPCLIDFYADWCAPCRLTSPILEDLAKQYAGKINIYKIDVEKEQELAAIFGVQSIPTFLFCPMEGMPTKSTGIANGPEATKQMFIQQIEELLLKNNNNSSAI